MFDLAIEEENHKNENQLQQKEKQQNQIQSKANKKASLYRNCLEALKIASPQANSFTTGGSRLKLFFLNLFAPIIFFCIFNLLKKLAERSNRPILCDISSTWPKGLFYQVNKQSASLIACNEVCVDAAAVYRNWENNYLFGNTVSIGFFLLRLNCFACLLLALCKKGNYCVLLLYIFCECVANFF